MARSLNQGYCPLHTHRGLISDKINGPLFNEAFSFTTGRNDSGINKQRCDSARNTSGNFKYWRFVRRLAFAEDALEFPGGFLRGGFAVEAGRSEERRVGKECRCRWVADHEKK